MTKREIYKKFTNLSKKELNTKNNKNPYARNDVMTTIIKQCRGEKARGMKAIDGFRKKIIQTMKFLNVNNLKLNQKYEKSLKSIIPLKNIVKIYKIGPYIYTHYEKNTS